MNNGSWELVPDTNPQVWSDVDTGEKRVEDHVAHPEQFEVFDWAHTRAYRPPGAAA